MTPKEYSDLARRAWEKGKQDTPLGSAAYFAWKVGWLSATCAQKDAQLIQKDKEIARLSALYNDHRGVDTNE